ncbi:MAG: pyridoxal-phosphate dependent enzyme, partial [Bacteroidetes bacterium]|nr:pyridoxal-phosphate dependent enzyme [Bacteroidota bacterium]
MWHDSILGTIGQTPLVRINRIGSSFDVTVLAKVEFFNPGSSVKDRIGIKMIEAAEADGSLKPGGTIIEGTSGNTGAGLALAAIAKGYRCIFTTQDKQSPEKADVLRALGAEVLVCPTNVAPDDPRSYYSVAKRLSEEIPNSVYLNQYENPSNTQAHYETTGPEIWEGTDGRITHFVVASGTGGTVSGAAAFLKEKNPAVKVIGVDPFGSVYYKYFHTREFDQREIYPYVTEGAGEDILAGNMDFDLIDDYVRVTDKETMIMTRRLAREEGLFVGQTSGMAMAGILQWLEAHRDEVSEKAVIVVILPDTGFRYLSKTYNDAWMRNHGFLDTALDLTVSQVLTARIHPPTIVTVESDSTLGEAADRMTKHGISQLPVAKGSEIIGSLREIDVLNRLIEDPHARSESVARIMAEPLPVVPR